MKRLIITLSLLVISIVTYSQNSYKLDQKNGFNIFILGTSLQENKKLVALNKIKMKGKSDAIEMYQIKRIDQIKLFGYDVTSIYLVFYKENLLQIEVNFKNWEFGNNDQSPFIQMDIANKISKEYGSWNSQDLDLEDDIKNVNFKQYINGTKVCLWRYCYKAKQVSALRSIFQGDRYLFVSNEIFNKMNLEKEDPSGL